MSLPLLNCILRDVVNSYTNDKEASNHFCDRGCLAASIHCKAYLNKRIKTSRSHLRAVIIFYPSG